MDPRTIELLNRLELFREGGRSTSRQAAVKHWVQASFGESASASFVSEAKQIPARAAQNIQARPTHRVFIVKDTTVIDGLFRRVHELRYQELKAVLAFEMLPEGFRPCRVDRYAPSAVVDLLLHDFPDTAVMDFEGDPQALRHAGPVEPDSRRRFEEIVWQVPVPEDLCGLLGLGEAFEAARAALASGKHVILFGPPGTGKTELAECICRTLGARYRTVTANAEWSTFDLIGGYFPLPEVGGERGDRLDFVPGIVTEAIQLDRWVVIDEINRADIDKCFGELFTLLAGKSVMLPYRQRVPEGFVRVMLGEPADEDDEGIRSIPVPPDWRLIATMNSFDKASLQRLSFAFMRRFAFVDVPIPPPGVYEDILLRTAGAGSDVARDAVVAIFAGTGSGSLQAARLAVGPALAIDVLKHLGVRGGSGSDASTLPSRLFEALKAHVFPQFEGQEEHHRAVVEALVQHLGEEMRKAVSDALAVWTGYRDVG